MYEISKSFHFDFGHRVWSQALNKEFCEGGNDSCKCKLLHGHSGLMRIYLESDNLVDQGFVTDFKHLGFVKDFIDEYIDHKFIIDIHDPAFEKITGVHEYKVVPFTIIKLNDIVAGQVFDGSSLKISDLEKEILESFFIVDFVPTSENFCKWMFDLLTPIMKKLDVKVSAVEWCETLKSKCIYRPRPTVKHI